MYQGQLIPQPNNYDAHRAVRRQLLREEQKFDLDDLKWRAGTAFSAWLLLVVASVMLGTVPSGAGYTLWGAFFVVACCAAIGLQAVRKKAQLAALQRMVDRGDLYLPSEAVIGWVRGKLPEATQMSRLQWVCIASPFIDQLRACDEIFKQTPFGEAQMDEVDDLIWQLLAELRKANTT